LADVPGDADALRLETNPKTNNGVMKAEAGAALDVYGSTITQAPTAEIAADGAASMVRLRGGASISGGSFASRNGGALICNDGSNSLAGVVLPAGTWLGVRGYGRQLHLSGPTITNEGQIVVNYENAWESRVIVDNTLTLLGAGMVILNRSGSDAQLSTVAGATLTQAAGHTVRGFGEMNAAMINHGAVVADVVGQSLVVNPQESGVTNQGTFEARLGCTLQLNNAALFTQPGGRIVASGILNVSGAPLSLQGGRLLGAGTVNGSVQNTAAVVEPGESIGTLTVNGSYAQGASGRLELEMAGVIPGADYDRLAVGGSVTLGGELCVLPVAGYSPPPDQEFVILTASSVSGEFERQAGPARFAVTYNPTNVTIRCIAAPGDVNCDSAVDSLDVGAFVIALVNPPAFQAAYPGCDMFKADMNGDGQVDGRDIALFLSLLFGG
ncbi:MAG: dockerin type I domain-containing protein, partial [Phycisphaerae bacterium]|nr:dockerin type I domain-containing protein [Phycisphaerae bacterium]